LGYWIEVKRPRSHYPRLVNAQLVLWLLLFFVLLLVYVRAAVIVDGLAAMLQTWVACNVISFFLLVAQLWHWHHPRPEA
ncbi:MAG: hypothetical protein ABL949_15530, partial [Fimbriimonadaceae bacterium]